MWKICAACKEKFRDMDNGLFTTCSSCRKTVDLKKEAKKRQQSRDNPCSGHPTDIRDSYRSKEDIYETKYGIDD